MPGRRPVGEPITLSIAVPTYRITRRLRPYTPPQEPPPLPPPPPPPPPPQSLPPPEDDTDQMSNQSFGERAPLLGVPGNMDNQYGQNPFRFYNRYAGAPAQRPRTPYRPIHQDGDLGKDPHTQFCALTGCPPTNAAPDFRFKANERTLYGRAIHMAKAQSTTYTLTAALTNTLLLLQIVLGAALTGLGGAGVKPWVITVFGASNTIIAGLVAYLKSRGQPMRARMFMDDLERVVDEIENSEVMWLGVAKGVHGYDGIDTDEDVTVRGEVARLTRLLEKAIRSNLANNPDLYTAGSAGGSDPSSGGGRSNPFMTLTSNAQLPPIEGASGANVAAVPTVTTTNDDDEAPATRSKKKEDEEKEKKAKEEEAAKKAKEEEAKKAEASTNGDAKATAPAAAASSSGDDKGKAKETFASVAASANKEEHEAPKAEA